MTIKLFDYVNSIFYGKENLVRKDDFVEDDINNYVPFIVNKALANNADTILYANLMNLNSQLDSKYQYEFLFNSIRKKKRYGKWRKYNDDENIKLICDVYGVTTIVSKTYLKLLDEEKIKQLKELKNIGGVKK